MLLARVYITEYLNGLLKKDKCVVLMSLLMLNAVNPGTYRL